MPFQFLSTALLALSLSTANTLSAAPETFASQATQAAGPIVQVQTTGARSGTFVDVEHPTSGKVEIIPQADGTNLLRLHEDFQTDNGPALEVILYEHAEIPLNIEGTGRYISLGVLQQVSGTQDYIIPADVDISQFGSVGIWCQEFDATFGFATI